MKLFRNILLVISIFSLAACGGEKKQETREPLSVKVSPVRQIDDTYKITASGVITSQDNPSKVSFLVSGRVLKAVPREGDYVRAGQLLAELDATDYKSNLDKAKAAADMAKAAFMKAKSPARAEQLAQAKIAYDRTADEYRRMKMLYDNKSLAPNDFEKFQAAYESAKQQYDMAKTGAQPEDKAQAKAGYEQAMAYVRLAEKALNDTVLKAPVSGFVTKRICEAGETIQAGYPVFEISPLDPVEVNAGVAETDIRFASVGQAAQVSVPALADRKFSGTVRVINVSADPATRTYMTRITVPNPDKILRLGMVAEIIIDTKQPFKAMTVPVNAVLRDAQGATIVYVYYPDKKKAYSKQVETGSVYGQEAVIKSGLKGNELIVTAGQNKLADGLDVSPVK